MSLKIRKAIRKPLTFQIIDYYDTDYTNEELNEFYETEDIDPNTCKNPSSRSVIYWWNFVKSLWLDKRKTNYILYLFGRTDTGESISVQVKDFSTILICKTTR